MTTEPGKKNVAGTDDNTTGFNMDTQKLHCLIVLNDQIAEVLSSNAGKAFWRAFITEDRESGEVTAKFRYRYKDSDSWARLLLDPEKQLLPVAERVEYLAMHMKRLLQAAVEIMVNSPAPEGVVAFFYPPEPDDAQKTLEWLVAQGLVEIAKVYRDGSEILVSKKAQA